MIERVLEPHEWDRLEITGIHPIFSDFRNEDVAPIVIEEDGEIVASVIAVRVVHLECLWIREDKRGNPGLIRKLLRKTKECARKWAGAIVMAQSRHENVCELLVRLGAMPMTDAKSFVLPLGNALGD